MSLDSTSRALQRNCACEYANFASRVSFEVIVCDHSRTREMLVRSALSIQLTKCDHFSKAVLLFPFASVSLHWAGSVFCFWLHPSASVARAN